MLRVTTDRPSATAALEQIRDGRTDGAEDELPAALLSMIAACAVTAEGKQTIRGIGNERNGANRAHSKSSNITAIQTVQIRARFLNLKSQVFPYKDGEEVQQGECGGGDPSPFSNFPKCESVFPEAMRPFLFGRRRRPRLS